MCLIADGELGSIVREMNAALDDVQTGEITTATRNVEIDDVPVQEGQIIGLLDGKLVASSSFLEETTLSVLKAADTQDTELISLYYGQNIPKPDANRIADDIRTAYPDHLIEVLEGGQPQYQFIIAIE